MSLIIATGSNIGNQISNLNLAKIELSKIFTFVEESSIYLSPAIEYENQPDFYNQVLQFELPQLSPQDVINQILHIEKSLGRTRDISKGPRTIDIDIIFWGLERINETNLVVPHPAWSQRSFVVKPLAELSFFQTLKNHFIIPTSFNNTAEKI